MTSRTPEQYDWSKALFNDRRLTKNFTSPRRSKITHVTLHHMTIVAPADKPRSTIAVEGAYKTWMGGRAASANYGVSGELVWQYVSDNDAAWSDANSTSNHSTLSIEHANSTAGPKWQVSDATMRTGQRLVACLHRLYGLGRPSRKTVRVHQDYYATACPGPYMMARLDDYIAAAAHFYDNPGAADPEPPVEPPAVTDFLDPANYPDAAHPDRNTTGPQITWLGQRLVAHGFDKHYASGPGPNWSEADRANVADFQKAQGWTGDDADGYPGPTTLRLLAADPTVTPPKPPGVTVTSVSQNFAGNNAHGIATAVARIRRYVAARKSTPVDIINAQECTVASLVRPRLDSGLEPLGYARVNGGKGRYQYRGADVTVLAHGLITTPRSTWFMGDDKQAAWVVYSKGGAVGMDVSLHLESASGATADRLRVDQAKYIAGQAMKIAELHGCPLTNVLLVGDTNSEGMVLAALVKAGWRNCAAGTEFENAHTFMGWDGKSRKRFDYGFVRQDAPDAKVVAISHDTSISDHAGLRIERELTA